MTTASANMIGMQVDVHEILREGVERTDRALERLLPPVTQVPASIHGAMRHSVFAGGKRLRPILAMEAARSMNSVRRGALPEGIEDLGAAIEMLHTYSLIHDDLPALDNDDLRRGKPTCHVAFGEAIAILAGRCAADPCLPDSGWAALSRRSKPFALSDSLRKPLERWKG